MSTCCYAPRHDLVHAFLLAAITVSACGVSAFGVSACGVSACGSEAPPPPARSASGLHGSPLSQGEAAPTGGSTASLGDSALEPAALEATKAEDWGRAESLYRELVRRQPRSGTAKHGLGVALMRQQKNDQAIEMLEESVHLSDDAHARLDLAAAFGAVGRYPSALPHLRKAVQLAPRDPIAWKALADALVKVEKPEAAADALQDSRKTCPACAKNEEWNQVTDEVARASVVKAEKQIAAGDLPGAHKSAEAALALRPKMPEGHLAAGKVARAEGDIKGATNAFRKAVEQTPDAVGAPGAGARLELATMLIGDGNGAEAVNLAEQVVAAHGDDGAALDTLGRACDAKRDADCARRAYGRLVKLPAQALSEDGRSKGALEHARLRMKELKPRRRR